jgi:hypothetical protein
MSIMLKMYRSRLFGRDASAARELSSPGNVGRARWARRRRRKAILCSSTSNGNLEGPSTNTYYFFSSTKSDIMAPLRKSSPVDPGLLICAKNVETNST